MLTKLERKVWTAHLLQCAKVACAVRALGLGSRQRRLNRPQWQHGGNMEAKEIKLGDGLSRIEIHGLNEAGRILVAEEIAAGPSRFEREWIRQANRWIMF